MPPRKRARRSQAATPDPKTPAADHSSPAQPDTTNLSDPWTDEEEIALFKGLMRWKPTGMHKHFRLMALHAWMLENRFIHPANPHTRPQGIWTKLNTLYDLPALDAREDARQLPEKDSGDEDDKEEGSDVYSEAANKIEAEEFSLPVDEGYYEEEMWKRRLPGDDGMEEESEPELPELNMAEQPPARLFMPSFSIEPSEAATPSSRKGKASSAKKQGDGKKATTRRSTRQAESVADEDEGAEEEGEEDGDEDEEEEDGKGSDEESRASTPAARSTRAAKGTTARGKGAAKPKERARRRR